MADFNGDEYPLENFDGSSGRHVGLLSFAANLSAGEVIRYKMQARCSTGDVHYWVNDDGSDVNRPPCAGVYGPSSVAHVWIIV